MAKETIDNYEQGKEIPYFALSMKLKDGATPRPLRKKIYFDGVGKPVYITIARNPGQYN